MKACIQIETSTQVSQCKESLTFHCKQNELSVTLVTFKLSGGRQHCAFALGIYRDVRHKNEIKA
jgi:hypothetical protein